MRLIVMYDLEMITSEDIKEYTKFRNNLIRNGFIMIQQSIYSKICLNQDVINWTENKMQKFLPKKGNIRTISITEKQYSKMKIFLGCKSIQEKLITDRRFLEI